MPTFTPPRCIDSSLQVAKERATRFVEDAFPPGTPPRSEEYKQGMSAFFLFSLAGEKITCPYTEGRADFDAFFAGVDAGRAIARRDADK
jgi:hypothetical protein